MEAEAEIAAGIQIADVVQPDGPPLVARADVGGRLVGARRAARAVILVGENVASLNRKIAAAIGVLPEIQHIVLVFQLNVDVARLCFVGGVALGDVGRLEVVVVHHSEGHAGSGHAAVIDRHAEVETHVLIGVDDLRERLAVEKQLVRGFEVVPAVVRCAEIGKERRYSLDDVVRREVDAELRVGRVVELPGGHVCRGAVDVAVHKDILGAHLRKAAVRRREVAAELNVERFVRLNVEFQIEVARLRIVFGLRVD